MRVSENWNTIYIYIYIYIYRRYVSDKLMIGGYRLSNGYGNWISSPIHRKYASPCFSTYGRDRERRGWLIFFGSLSHLSVCMSVCLDLLFALRYIVYCVEFVTALYWIWYVCRLIIIMKLYTRKCFPWGPKYYSTLVFISRMWNPHFFFKVVGVECQMICLQLWIPLRHVWKSKKTKNINK